MDERKQVKARAAHKCEVCGGMIEKGTECILRVENVGGKFSSRRMHIHCETVLNAFIGQLEEREPFNQDDLWWWIVEKGCYGCPMAGGCEKDAFACPRVIEKLVPDTYKDAALASARKEKHG